MPDAQAFYNSSVSSMVSEHKWKSELGKSERRKVVCSKSPQALWGEEKDFFHDSFNLMLLHAPKPTLPPSLR